MKPVLKPAPCYADSSGILFLIFVEFRYWRVGKGDKRIGGLDREEKMLPKQYKKLKIETRLMIIGLIVAAVACVAAVMVVPEFRRLLKLEEYDLTTPNANLRLTVMSQTYEPFKQTPTINMNNLLDIYPLFVGATWTYNYSQFIEPANTINLPNNPEFGQFTITVVVIDSGFSDRVKIVGMKVSGENYFNICFNEGRDLFAGDLQTWYVLDSKSMYVTCTREQVYMIAKERMANPDNVVISDTVFPMLVTPLEVGKLWPAFADIPPRDDTFYQWYVESKVDISLPAGKFKDCFRILLNTLGDSLVRWICPGIGMVAEEYHHRGAINDYRYELQNYSIIVP